MMKVQPPKEPAKCGYPALAKVTALVAVSCAVSACQQVAGVAPCDPPTIIVVKEKK